MFRKSLMILVCLFMLAGCNNDDSSSVREKESSSASAPSENVQAVSSEESGNAPQNGSGRSGDIDSPSKQEKSSASRSEKAVKLSL